MTRVIHLHLHPRRTGVTRHVETVVRALASEFQAAIFGTTFVPALPRVGALELLRMVRRGPTILHAHRNLEILLGLLLRAVGPRVRLVATRHSATAPSWLTRALLGWVDLRIALTEEGADSLERPREIIGHGIELQRFSPPARRDEAFRALGLPGRLGAGVVGRVRPTKGQADFVEAWRRLVDSAQKRPEWAEWTPILVGAVRPKDRDFAESLRRRLPSLVLTGEVSNVEAWLRGLSIVVQPSPSEGFSLVVLEAMASGACVVAARLPHFERGIIQDGETGFLYPPGDADALCKILERLLSLPERIQEVGARAAEHARRALGVEAEAARLGACYRRLLEPEG